MATNAKDQEKKNGLKKQIGATILNKENAPKINLEKNSKAEIQKTNEDVHLQQVISRRKLKYIYPKDCKTAEKRKSYRAKVRAQIKNLESAIAKAKGEARIQAKEELTAYKALNLA